MKTSGFRAGAAVCALATGLWLAAPAEAQTVGEGGGGDEAVSGTISPPAERWAITPGGVDMRTGRYGYSQTDLSIGEDSETGGLALTRSMSQAVAGHVNPFGNFTQNWDVYVTLRPININEGNYHCCGTDLRVEVQFGGRSETFQQPAGQSWFDQISRSGYARLAVAGSVYTFTANDGTVAVFRPVSASECSSAFYCGFVSQITYADGTRFNFEYDSGSGVKRLRSVVSNRGYALLFQYGSGSDANHVTSACVINLAIQAKPSNNACPATPQASASYSYTTLGTARRLASATDAAGGTWGFGYASVANGFTMAFTRPGEATAWLTNTVWQRLTMDSLDEIVTHQAFADGATYSYSYDTSPLVEGEIPQIAGGSYVDPAGATVEIRYAFPAMPSSFNPPRVNSMGYPYVNYGDVIFQVTPGPVEIVDALGRTSTIDYCDPAPTQGCLVRPMPVSFTSPEGIETELLYDLTTRLLGQSRQNAEPGSALADIVQSWTYNCTPSTMPLCNRPTSRTDANGNVTSYSYNTTHGGLLAETGPAVNGVAPQTRHAYAQRHAWISNGSGGYVQAATPIWVRTETSACRTSAATGNPSSPCTAGALDEVRTVYDYGPNSGPNNLLLRGQAVTAEVGGQLVTHRTCYGYDARGRRVSETQPNANLSTCP